MVVASRVRRVAWRYSAWQCCTSGT